MKLGVKIEGGKGNTVSRGVRIAGGKGAYRGWFQQLKPLHAYISKTVGDRPTQWNSDSKSTVGYPLMGSGPAQRTKEGQEFLVEFFMCYAAISAPIICI